MTRAVLFNRLCVQQTHRNRGWIRYFFGSVSHRPPAWDPEDPTGNPYPERRDADNPHLPWMPNGWSRSSKETQKLPYDISLPLSIGALALSFAGLSSELHGLDQRDQFQPGWAVHRVPRPCRQAEDAPRRGGKRNRRAAG